MTDARENLAGNVLLLVLIAREALGNAVECQDMQEVQQFVRSADASLVQLLEMAKAVQIEIDQS